MRNQSAEASINCRLRGVRDLSRAGCWASRTSSACHRATSPNQKALSLGLRAPTARRRHSSARRRKCSILICFLPADRPTSLLFSDRKRKIVSNLRCRANRFASVPANATKIVSLMVSASHLRGPVEVPTPDAAKRKGPAEARARNLPHQPHKIDQFENSTYRAGDGVYKRPQPWGVGGGGRSEPFTLWQSGVLLTPLSCLNQDIFGDRLTPSLRCSPRNASDARSQTFDMV
jgi:hypothetical protein